MNDASKTSPRCPGVGGDDGEAAGERGIALPRPPQRRRHGAVQAAPALEQEAPVPLGGERQREPDAVALAVPARAPVERRAQPAVGGQRDGERRHPGRLLRRGRAGREPRRLHLRQRGARNLQLPEGRARGLAGCYLRPGRRGGKRECGDRRSTESQDSHARPIPRKRISRRGAVRAWRTRSLPARARGATASQSRSSGRSRPGGEMSRRGRVTGLTGVLSLAVSIAAGRAPANEDFLGWAETPPMGWNSWDCFGTTVTEAQAKAQADLHGRTAPAVRLAIHRRRHPVVRAGRDQGHDYRAERAARRWTSSAACCRRRIASRPPANGAGFKPLADYVHAKGLKFGIHLMRGIPRQAVRAEPAGHRHDGARRGHRRTRPASARGTPTCTASTCRSPARRPTTIPSSS